MPRRAEARSRSRLVPFDFRGERRRKQTRNWCKGRKVSVQVASIWASQSRWENALERGYWKSDAFGVWEIRRPLVNQRDRMAQCKAESEQASRFGGPLIIADLIMGRNVVHRSSKHKNPQPFVACIMNRSEKWLNSVSLQSHNCRCEGKE